VTTVLYDYECPRCKHCFEDFRSVDERHTSICPTCGETAKLVLTFNKEGAHAHTFKPYWDKHISSEPVYIESREQKVELLKKNHLIEKEYHVDGDQKTVRWV
jgi:putative FmdB family regulatory protein